MKVSVAFLGGVGEIGMNCYVYETENSAFIVDCGVKFAGGTEPGIDLIIPDFGYLYDIKHKLKCVLITHAHEDHGGALAFLLNEFRLPVAADRYTMGLISRRLKEYDIGIQKIYLEYNIPLDIGDFVVNYIPISHSVHGTGVLYIQALDGFTALHMSDYKADFAPLTSEPFPCGELARIGKNGLSCLLADSTSCLSKGFTAGEKTVQKGIEKVFKESLGRIFFTAFSSNAERLQTVFDMAEKYGRAVIIEGSSLIRNIDHARLMGRLKVNDKIIARRKALNILPDNKICVIATGSQGEKESVISKIVANEYSIITLRENDTFVFSSRIIPGNERNVILVMNKIAKAGGRCITADDDNIHVSGHPSQADAAMLIKITRPDYLVPIHGEHIHLRKHKEIAVNDCGMDENRVILSCEGEKLIFTDGVFTGREEVPWGKRFVDTRGGFILTKDELKLRKRMASDGVVFICLWVDIEKGLLMQKPVISSAGFNMSQGSIDDLITYVKKECENTVFERFSIAGWQELSERLLKKYFKRTTGRRPIISAVIKEII